MLRRMVVSGTDISVHCSGVKRPKMVEAGWMASDLRSKRFVARRMICSLSMNAQAASFEARSMVKTAPGNDRLKDNGDGTFTLEINLTGDPILDVLDAQHLLFTGDRFTPLKLYYYE